MSARALVLCADATSVVRNQDFTRVSFLTTRIITIIYCQRSQRSSAPALQRSSAFPVDHSVLYMFNTQYETYERRSSQKWVWLER